MAIAHPRLLRHVILDGRHQVEARFRARHRDVEQAPLFVDQLGAAGGEFGREAAVGHVQHVDRVPLLALRRVHGGEHEVVLVEERRAREIAGRGGRIQGELGEESFPCLELKRNLFQLLKISRPDLRLLVDALEVRLEPLAHAPDLPRPEGFRSGQ